MLLVKSYLTNTTEAQTVDVIVARKHVFSCLCSVLMCYQALFYTARIAAAGTQIRHLIS